MNGEDKLQSILGHFAIEERPLWIAEANRLATIVERYRRRRGSFHYL